MKEFTVNTDYGTYEHCTYSKEQYRNKHVAIELYCDEGPLATLTVNIPGIEAFPENYSCIDTNNCPWGEDLAEELRIGKFVGKYLYSGFCSYPVYKFDI